MSKPKEILINAIIEFLLVRLEKDGFSFQEKSTKFTKKNECGFTYEFNFLGSRTNWLDQMVDFHVQYLVFVPKYKSWHKKNFPNQTMLGGGYLQGDTKLIHQQSTQTQHGFGHDFVKFHPKDIMDEIWDNYQRFGKRYFDSVSDWSHAHENATTVSQKIDSLIFQDKMEEAMKFAQKTLDGFVEPYGKEENIPGNLKQYYEIVKSRINYLEKKHRL